MVLLQSLAANSFNSTVDNIYSQFLPYVGNLVMAGRAIAGTGALFYIAVRVWKSLVNVEPIDFYPLFRPLAIALLLVLYSPFIACINVGLSPLVAASNAILTNSVTISPTSQTAYKNVIYQITDYKSQVLGNADQTLDGIQDPLLGNKKLAGLQISYRLLIYESLKFLYSAVPMVIIALRTFILIILMIAGPISLGLSVWNGLGDSLLNWIKGYIVIYLWLPIYNIITALFTSLYVSTFNTIVLNVNNAPSGDNGTLSSSDTTLMCLMLIAVIGNFAIPFIANYLVKVSGFVNLVGGNERQ